MNSRIRVKLYVCVFSSLSAMTSVHIRKVVDDDGIIKSAEDKRHYRALELTNGMRLMLISDPQTDKSSAAMDVYIGRNTWIYLRHAMRRKGYWTYFNNK